MFCFSVGRFLKNVLKGSVNFIFPNSTNFKIAVAVNCFVLEPISKIVFGPLRVLVCLLASPLPLLIMIFPIFSFTSFKRKNVILLNFISRLYFPPIFANVVVYFFINFSVFPLSNFKKYKPLCRF
jgi:hypothetical protein